MPVSNIDVLDATGVSRNVNAPNSNGQANMAGSRSVAIASDQSAVPVSLTSLPALATGGNVIGGVTQSGTWNVTNISGTVSLPTGASTSANQTTLNTNVGSSADAILTAGVAGSLASYMRTVMEQTLSTAASSVKIDQTTPGTTNAFSIAHIGSTAAATGNGVVGAGVLRVAIASDNTAFSVNAVQSGTWNVATLTSLSQFAGNAINLGAGAVGTGTLRVTQASDSPLVTAFGTAGTAKTYTGTFTVAGTALTRPANTTAYSIGDSISNNGTAASVTTTAVALSDTNDHPIDLAEIILDSTDTGPGTAGATIRLHLYNADYTASTGVQAGDNAARSQKKNGWVGSFSGTMQAFFDGSKGRLVADTGNLLMAVPVSGAKTFYWELEARTAFTPSANSTTFTPTFKGFQSRPA